MMRTLRPYQNEAIESARRDLAKTTSTLIVLPTGTGKTVVASKLISEWGRGNALFLAHRTELLKQAQKHLERELGFKPSIEQSSRKVEIECMWQGGAVIVGSVPTMKGEARLQKFSQHPFDLIIIDEAHHATAASYRKICDYFLGLNSNCKIVGITATPKRTDKTAMGLVFNTACFNYPIHTAVEDGWLVPVRQESIVVEGVDFAGCRMGKNEFQEADLNAKDLESILTEEEPLHALAIPTMERAEGRQGIVFTAGVAHAHLLAAIMNRQREGCAAAVDGTTDATKRDEIVRSFYEGKLQFLVNFGVFTEGFDAPPASVVVMGRPTKSQLIYTQMLGRVLRPLDGVVDGFADAADRRMAILTSDKPFALCLDFVGNGRMKLVTATDVLGGNYDVNTQKRAQENLAAKKGAGSVTEELRKAQVEMILEAEQEARRNIRANVSYTSHESDVFGGPAGPVQVNGEQTRGGSTDCQIAFLVGLGVDRTVAAGYSRRQAGAVIDSMRATRCTGKQRGILQKYGYPTDGVGVDKASEIIDAIAKNGWRRPSE